MPRTLGVCSWSLRPESPTDLARKVAATGLSAVQLALEPLRTGAWGVEETRAVLARAGIEIRSGMAKTRGEDYTTPATIRATGGVRRDEHWKANLAAFAGHAALARTLGMTLVTFHAGFLPVSSSDESPGAERAPIDDPLRATMVARLRAVADVFAAQGVAVGLETGQERADTLLAVLREIDRSNVGVNFDPANMILYGTGEPVGALRALAPWVRQIHAKDATPPGAPEAWGREVPVGEGDVDWDAFFDVVRGHELDVDLMIEREAGMRRVEDVRAACVVLEPHRDRLHTSPHEPPPEARG